MKRKNVKKILASSFVLAMTIPLAIGAFSNTKLNNESSNVNTNTSTLNAPTATEALPSFVQNLTIEKNFSTSYAYDYYLSFQISSELYTPINPHPPYQETGSEIPYIYLDIDSNDIIANSKAPVNISHDAAGEALFALDETYTYLIDYSPYNVPIGSTAELVFYIDPFYDENNWEPIKYEVGSIVFNPANDPEGWGIVLTDVSKINSSSASISFNISGAAAIDGTIEYQLYDLTNGEVVPTASTYTTVSVVEGSNTITFDNLVAGTEYLFIVSKSGSGIWYDPENPDLNYLPYTIEFKTWTESHVAIVLLIALLIGLILAWIILTIISSFSKRKKLAVSEEQQDTLNSEIGNVVKK